MEFEQIYSTYFKAVYLYVLQLTGDVHTAEEITSETFFKAINTVDRFRGDCDMRVWLCQIARNRYLILCRERSRCGEMAAESGDSGIEEGFAHILECLGYVYLGNAAFAFKYLK